MIRKSAEKYYRMGRNFAKKYSDEAALACYDIAIELKPDFEEAYTSRGIIRQALNDYKGARQDFARAFKLNPMNIKAYIYCGCLTVNYKKYLDKAVELAPNNVDALCERGSYYACRKGRYDVASRDIEKAIAVEPENSTGYYYRGLFHYHQKQWEAAIADFDKSIKLESGKKNYKAYAFRANAKIQLEQYASALTDLNRFVEISPKPQQSKMEFFTLQKQSKVFIDRLEQGKWFFNRSKEYPDDSSFILSDKKACLLLAKECFEEAMKSASNDTFIEYRDTLSFGLQVIDYLIECRRNENGVEKCPKCSGGLIYYCADAYCETCGWSQCR